MGVELQAVMARVHQLCPVRYAVKPVEGNARVKPISYAAVAEPPTEWI